MTDAERIKALTLELAFMNQVRRRQALEAQVNRNTILTLLNSLKELSEALEPFVKPQTAWDRIQNYNVD